MHSNKVVFPVSVGFNCKNCGVCCKMQPPDVNLAEQKRIELKGFSNFLELPDEGGIRWVKRRNGYCFFLAKDNKCAIYDVRPAICRLEPFTLVDYDHEKNQIELELNFPFSSCCPGVCENTELNTAEITKAAQAILGKILLLTAKDLNLPITDRKVHSETRSRLLRRATEAADLQL